ncbi:ecotin family protein [Cyanobium sp. T1B-Tous]|uniref:ecotin family protein n=1 Tax=Cyanobium sp. T1B-Tous TaxID=2823721 RepID=UPI0020CCA18E|nr:ecotin family protein [Cyanobium sp. T1B-Tous]MCP9807458.1 ecotin family protein [Cyanobium sp. T1B-Tous]
MVQRLRPWLRSPRVLGLACGALALALVPASVPQAGAIPRLDLSGYPKPALGDRRWVIQLPGVLRPNVDPALSPNPTDWRVQLIVGQMAELDCNRQVFGGKLRPVKPAQEGGPVIYRVTDVGALASTRMACPPEQPRRRAFVPMAGKAFVVPYNASRPIVVDAPRPLELRWRLWKAESQERPANLF